MSSGTEAGRHYQAALVELSERARGLDVRCYEEADAHRCRTGLLPEVGGVIADGVTLAQAVLDRYDALAEQAGATIPSLLPRRSHRPHATHRPASNASGTPVAPPAGQGETSQFRFDMDTLVGDQNRGPALVADIAFMMLMELRERQQRLARVESSDDLWELVDAAGSALRRVLKSCTALELVVSEVERLRPCLDYQTELASSLEVRRRYARLREAIGATDPPSADSLLVRLRLVGTQIAMLIGQDIYPELRVRDRVQLRALQRRIIEWLRGSSDTRVGMRLWQDLVGFANLIALVNKRQELIQHDASLASQALQCLANVESGGKVPDSLWVRLPELRGACASIDTLLISGARDAGAWRRALASMRGSEPARPPHSQVLKAGEIWPDDARWGGESGR